MNRVLQFTLGGILALATAGCSDPRQEAGHEPPRVAEADYVEAGDLPAIEERGRLRLLVPAEYAGNAAAAPPDSPVPEQVEYAARFARSLDLEPVLVPVEHADELIPALRDGRGDVIIANLPMNDHYRQRIDFTVPLDRSRRSLVARADDPIEDFDDLPGRTITVPFDSHFWETARELQTQFPGLRVDSLPALGEARTLELVANGEADLTLAEGNFLASALAGREDLRAVFPVSTEKGVAWGIRQESPRLKDMLDRFITQEKLVQTERQPRTADLAGIRESRTLRLATRNSAANYFIWRGQMLGFEYELAQRFANEIGVRLEVIVADDGESLPGLVRAGEADIAAAFLGRAARDDDAGIAWSRPYHEAAQQVVGRPGDRSVETVDDLDGRTFHVRDDSRYARTLRLLASIHGLDLAIEAVPAGQQPEQTLQHVAAGEYDLTLIDGHLARNATSWIDGLQPLLEVGREISHHWAVREDNPELLTAIDGYLERVHRSAFYNTLYAKYFQDRDRVRSFSTQRIDLRDGQQISPWDDIVREYAQQYGFDWRLILAQIYQESSFNPDARSWAGARGLMQIMPVTATQVGVDDNLVDPETNIRAGLKYLAWLRERFEADLSIQDRMWFMLAAYNAGVGHVRDARRLADSLGYDRDRWFDNVEIAMEKLSQREYFQHARFGFVRGHEPVGYVRAIRERYQAYMLWTEDCWPVCSDSPHPQEREPIDYRGPGSMLQASY